MHDSSINPPPYILKKSSRHMLEVMFVIYHRAAEVCPHMMLVLPLSLVSVQLTQVLHLQHCHD